jgi:CRP/FNR family transcriptional regulator, cyclic AMP receptor protein
MSAESTLPRHVLDRFFAHGHTRNYAAGDIIISAGDYSSELYYLLSGSVAVQFEDKEGHEIILAYLHEGEMFGEIGMFDERHERSAWVRARGDCEIANISYDAMRRVVQDSPGVVYEMLGQLAMRVRNTSRKASALAFTDVAGRVARVLLDLCEQPEVEHRSDGVRLSITRQEIARLAGCSREMVSRVLRVLEERHVVGLEGRSIIVFHQDLSS